jgi:hypothetical protein
LEETISPASSSSSHSLSSSPEEKAERCGERLLDIDCMVSWCWTGEGVVWSESLLRYADGDCDIGAEERVWDKRGRGYRSSILGW